jgi:DNA-binding MarR family transcriptional regulator
MSTLLRAAGRAKAQDAASGGFFHAMGVLYVLAESGPLRANLLAEAVFSDPSTVSRQVALLVDRGLVAREPDPDDRRATLLAITDTGRRTLADRMRLREGLLARCTDGWPESDSELFAELFERFSRSFAASVTDSGPGHLSQLHDSQLHGSQLHDSQIHDSPTRTEPS